MDEAKCTGESDMELNPFTPGECYSKCQVDAIYDHNLDEHCMQVPEEKEKEEEEANGFGAIFNYFGSTYSGIGNAFNQKKDNCKGMTMHDMSLVD